MSEVRKYRSRTAQQLQLDGVELASFRSRAVATSRAAGMTVTASVAGFALAVATGCSRGPPSPPGTADAAPTATAPAGAAARAGFAPEERSVAELTAALADGGATSRGLVDAYLARIAALDRAGPRLGAVIELNPDAAAIADERDAERRAGTLRGPLHGIPVLVKDNVDTADAMATSAGSLALAAGHAPRDAHIVERLRAAGAVILGKTNLSEWANFRSSQSASGWSGRGGQTRNPYVLDRSPCGSSSGTGAAIAASLAAVGVGTETDGSIVCPSSVNGLVGIKPTVGLVSRAGIIPISASQDTAGPMARSVADAALLLGVLAGPDPRDPVTLGAPPVPDYVAALSTDALRGARIGVARRGHTGYSPATDAAFTRALDVLRAQGAVVVDPADVPNVDALGDCELDVLLFEFKAGVEAYLASRGPDVAPRTLDDLIAFNAREAVRELPWFGQDLFERAARKGPLSDATYRAARDRCRRLAGPQGIDAALHAQRLDALVAPTGGPAWPIDPVNGDHFTGGSSQVAAVAGYPAVTVPMGDIAGLPVGITFFGAAFREAQLASIAYAYEKATRHRRPPAFRPTLDVPAGPEPVSRPAAVPAPEPSP